MGTEGVWIPIVMSLVSAGTQYANNRSQQRKADRIALQSLQQTGDRQRRADQVTNQMLGDMAASTPDAERESTLRGFLDQLSRAEPQAQSGVRQFGGESDAYRRDAEAAALGITAEGQRHAGIASRLDAPSLQRRRESAMLTDRAIDLGMIGREQEGADRQSDLELRGIRSNPWLQALSAAAGAYGQAYQPRPGAGGISPAASSVGARGSRNPGAWLYEATA